MRSFLRAIFALIVGAGGPIPVTIYVPNSNPDKELFVFLGFAISFSVAALIVTIPHLRRNKVQKTS